MKPYDWKWILNNFFTIYTTTAWIKILSVLSWINSMENSGVNYRLNGARELLGLAINEREIFRIRDLFLERIFCRKIYLISKCFILGLVMCLISEINILRLTTLVLVGVLIGLSFYLVLLSWSRCEELTARLNQELQDFRDLMSNSNNEE